MVCRGVAGEEGWGELCHLEGQSPRGDKMNILNTKRIFCAQQGLNYSAQ